MHSDIITFVETKMSKKLKAWFATFLFTSFLSFPSTAFSSTVSTGSTNSSASKISPQQLYHQTWQLVRDNYYDPSFNGKDWQSWEHKFDGQLSTQAQAEKAISQMLAELGDKYTSYLNPKAAVDEQNLKESNLVGVGIYLVQPAGKQHTIVADVVEGGPAMQAGIHKNDELLAVDGQTVANLSPEEIGQKLLGNENSLVSLKLADKGQARDIKLKRQHFVVHPVTVKELPGNVGYIKLSSFIFDDAADEVRNALNRLSNKDGLILDLRENGGGLMLNALLIAEMFLDHGVIVRTLGRHGAANDSVQGQQLSAQPLVVLVNQNSASASEILSAALKEHKRATIVGTRTFGKGLMQEVYPLKNGGSLHLTIAQFMGPTGSKINHVGVQPHVVVQTDDAQLNTAVNVLKGKMLRQITTAPTSEQVPHGT